jgi:hypothetical protein
MKTQNVIAVAVGSVIFGGVTTAIFIRVKYRSDLAFLGVAQMMAEDSLAMLKGLIEDD